MPSDLFAAYFQHLRRVLAMGVERDLQEAVAWFRKAAEQGHAKGQSNLGRMYAGGLGVERDPVEAYQWFYSGGSWLVTSWLFWWAMHHIMHALVFRSCQKAI